MDAVVNLLESLVGVMESLLDVIVALVQLIVPWLPFLAWVGFWTFAVNWRKAFPIIQRGGFIGIGLLMLVTVLVWGAFAPPPEGTHFLFGLTVSNYAGKMIYVTTLTCIALLCGSLQLSGTFGSCCTFENDSEEQHPQHAAGH
jgi:hypothetical protein